METVKIMFDGVFGGEPKEQWVARAEQQKR